MLIILDFRHILKIYRTVTDSHKYIRVMYTYIETKNMWNSKHFFRVFTLVESLILRHYCNLLSLCFNISIGSVLLKITDA